MRKLGAVFALRKTVALAVIRSREGLGSWDLVCSGCFSLFSPHYSYPLPPSLPILCIILLIEFLTSGKSEEDKLEEGRLMGQGVVLGIPTTGKGE